MSTQMQLAREGKISDAIKNVADSSNKFVALDKKDNSLSRDDLKTFIVYAEKILDGWYRNQAREIRK